MGRPGNGPAHTFTYSPTLEHSRGRDPHLIVAQRQYPTGALPHRQILTGYRDLHRPPIVVRVRTAGQLAGLALSIVAVTGGSAPAAGSVPPAERSLLTGVQAGQQALFKELDAGFSEAFGRNLPGSPSFRKGAQSFLPAVQSAGVSFLERGGSATFARRMARAGQAWRKLNVEGGLSKRAPGAGAFVKATVAAETAFWRKLGAGVHALRAASLPPKAFQEVVATAGSAFTRDFERAVGTLLKGVHTSRSGRAALLRLLGSGIRRFTASLNSGARVYL